MKIVAVTACPAGLAHTYMAAEAIRRAAVRLGHTIKVETQGSMGIRDELTPKEIAEAEVVIFAVDMAVSKIDRFKEKKIHYANVGLAVRDPSSVVNAAINAMAAK